MIIQRYLWREIGLSFLAVALLLSVMFLSGTFVRLLSETLQGTYPARLLFTLFVLKGVGNLVFIMPFAFFIAVLLAFGRLYKDSEMVVLSACGVGPLRILKAVAIPAVVVAVVVGFLSLYFAPWSEEHSARLLDEAGAHTGIEGIAPGQFNPFGKKGPVVYVRSIDAKSDRLRDVFVRYRQGDKETVFTAQSGREYIDPDNGGRYLMLSQGNSYEGEPGQADYRVVHFDEYGLRLEDREVVQSHRPLYAIPTATLIRRYRPADVAELHWRLAPPFSTLLLGLLAVPLSKTNPRKGRYGGLFVGIMLYVIYNNVLTVGRSALGSGDIPSALGLWWVHLGLAALLVLLVWRQQSMPKPRPFRKPAAAGEAAT